MRSRLKRRFLAAVLFCALLSAFGSLPARAIVYHGSPDLPLAVALVVAGGGPGHFSGATLYERLTGPLQAAETQKLGRQFGSERVASALAVLTFAIDDVLKILTDAKVALPAPAPSPSDARSLALQLYAAGQAGNKWDVGYMLERVVSHPVHHAIMRDIDARFGARTNADFHVVLAAMMHDLAAAYAAPPPPVAGHGEAPMGPEPSATP